MLLASPSPTPSISIPIPSISSCSGKRSAGNAIEDDQSGRPSPNSPNSLKSSYGDSDEWKVGDKAGIIEDAKEGNGIRSGAAGAELERLNMAVNGIENLSLFSSLRFCS